MQHNMLGCIGHLFTSRRYVKYEQSKWNKMYWYIPFMTFLYINSYKYELWIISLAIYSYRIQSNPIWRNQQFKVVHLNRNDIELLWVIEYKHDKTN